MVQAALDDSKTGTRSIEKDKLETAIAKIVIDTEYETAKRNQKLNNDDFEAAIDQLECQRTEKDYDWMSDIFLPEQPSRMLTDASIIASQYFQTRDFVECYIQDESEKAKAKADTAKECINRTLNQKHLYYFQKFMRMKMINNLGGYVYLRCWWEKETKPVIRYKQEPRPLEVDVYNQPIVDPSVQQPKIGIVNVPYEAEQIVRDRFNFDVIDSRNVFTDSTYCYSIQQKDWVTVRFEKNLQELKADKETMGYINLDKLEAQMPPDETETKKDSYEKDIGSEPIKKCNLLMPFDIIERHGKFWCIVKERDEEGIPTKVKPGIDNFGKVLDKAEYINTIITFAKSKSTKTMIRFQANPYYDANGMSFKPIIRGICYIHPTKDNGLGDGKYLREIQNAINDTFNISNDRVKLATLPTLKGRKYALEDNTTVYFEPQHTIELENPDDLVEFQISDNIQGALHQNAMLQGMADRISAIFPTTMGDIPKIASTTATAVAGAESRSTTRSNYKALTLEHTLLTELYWIILQMTYRFAEEETAMKLMGEKVYSFDPDGDYIWKPLSQSIETEYSKVSKIKINTQLLGYVAQMPNPNTPKLINYILSRIFELAGDEYANYSKILLDERQQNYNPKGQNVENAGVGAASNQAGLAMSGIEEFARGM